EPVHRAEVGEVELAHVRGAGDPGRRLRAPVGVADRENHVPTGAGEGPGGLESEPRVGAGHREGAAGLVGKGRGVSAHVLQRPQRCAILTCGGDLRMGTMRERPPHWPTDRPQVVAHRGASDEVAEHTLGAYLAALDEGADGLECDVRLTADGHLVCVHDRDLRRTASRKGLISTSNPEDGEGLACASWKNPWPDLDDEAPDRDARLDGVLTLRKLLEAVADYDRRGVGGDETQTPTQGGGAVGR